MFERGKKDDVLNDATDGRSTVAQRSHVPASTSYAGQRGECAVIGQSIQINGDLRGNEDLRIEGDVSGTVELKNSNLTIGKAGKVRADVYAKSIAVDGTTEGDLYASERVVVHVNAQVRGNITAPKVGIEEGARFKGSIEMDPDAVEKALGKVNMQRNTKADSEPQRARPTETRPAASKTVARDLASNSNPPAGAA
ncbi:MAG TPA: polymer-forming cytoskeletal protein [Woeseiaceae bacterium]|nr:polymer-forming cytoskeletal protein [Woeseiaceae bacterium]